MEQKLGARRTERENGHAMKAYLLVTDHSPFYGRGILRQWQIVSNQRVTYHAHDRNQGAHQPVDSLLCIKDPKQENDNGYQVIPADVRSIQDRMLGVDCNPTNVWQDIEIDESDPTMLSFHDSGLKVNHKRSHSDFDFETNDKKKEQSQKSEERRECQPCVI